MVELNYRDEMIADEIFNMEDEENLREEVEAQDGMYFNDMSLEEFEQAMVEMENYYKERDIAYERVQEALAFLEDMTDPISDTIKAILKGEPHD